MECEVVYIIERQYFFHVCHTNIHLDFVASDEDSAANIKTHDKFIFTVS